MEKNGSMGQVEECMTTASLGPTTYPTKPKKAFSKVIRNPAMKDLPISSKEYFPRKKQKKPKKSLGGAPLVDGDITEALQRIKFNYSSKRSTVPNPEVMVLDPDYQGRPEWRSYGKSKYLLGWSLSHVANKTEAIQAINDITDFTTLLGSDDDKEYYDRVKYFFPEQAGFIRAYVKGKIIDPKIISDTGLESAITLIDLKSAKNNGFGF